ncbi:MAG TPA: hypothetical protein VHO25_05695, partial [Polyangiaceae bacterium]|nr:hypothetical protein [Polyangiaceae bacterium]
LSLLTLSVACDGSTQPRTTLRDDGGVLGVAGAGVAGAHSAPLNGGVASNVDAAAIQCSDFDFHPSPPAIDVVIENGRAAAIHLGNPALCQREYFKIASAVNPLRSWEGINCKHDCTGASLDPELCQADCPKPAPLPLEPGEVFTASWLPVLYERTLLPQHCCAQPNGVCSRECYVPWEATAGDYTLTLLLTDEHGDVLEQIDRPIQVGTGNVSVVID